MLVVAWLVLLGGTMSSRGFLLVTGCDNGGSIPCCRDASGEASVPDRDACCLAEAPSVRTELHQVGATDEPCAGCEDPCCFAMSVALIAGATLRGGAAEAAPSAMLPPESPRLRGRELFRPPLA